MEGFDPDKYLAETNQPAFDPDKYLTETKDVSEIESGARGAAQGITLGFADEIAGGAESLWDIATTDKELKDFKNLYKENRDESRANFKRAKEANPASYMTGEIGGTVATALVPIGSTATVARAALAGAGMGGAAAVGGSEKEDLEGLGKDFLVGAGLGAAGGAGGKYLANKLPTAAEKAGKMLEKYAGKRAFKALGPTKKMTEDAMARGMDETIGRDLLDSGVIMPGRSKAKMLEKVTGLVDESANALDDTLTKVANAEGQSMDDFLRLEHAKFSPQELASALKAKIRQEYSHLPEEVLEPRLKQVDLWLSKPGRMDIRDAQAFKTQMQKFIRDGSYLKENPGASQETLLGIRKGIKEGIERNADEAAEVIGQQGGQIREINKTFGGRLQAEDILADRVARDATNRTMSLTDYLAMIPAAVANPATAAGAVKTAAVGVANKLIREQGSATVAYSADKVAKLLLRSPAMQKLANANPNAFRSLTADVARRMSGGASGRTVGSEQKYVPEKEARRQFIEGN